MPLQFQNRFVTLLIATALSVPHALTAAEANRLTYLDVDNPYYASQTFPKLVTPQWIGEPGVEAAVVLSIDDMSDAAKYENFLRPVLERLKRIDDRAPVSIFANAVDPFDPMLPRWLREGLSLEVHTINHPCPLLCEGDFAKARANVDNCLDLLFAIPKNRPVAFRSPCCDIWNTQSPRFFTEIFNKCTKAGRFMTVDSTIHQIFTADDPELPRELTIDEEGRDRFAKFSRGGVQAFGLMNYVYVNFVPNYPYPFVVSRLCWELPVMVPGDHQAASYEERYGRRMLKEWKAGLDCTAIKQGLMTLCFHPHGKCTSEELVELIDHAQNQHGNRVKFLNCREVEERLTKNLLAGHPLRAEDGSDNGVRVLDLDRDGFLDVVVGNEKARISRIWSAATRKWTEVKFPVQLATVDVEGKRRDLGARFGIVHDDGYPTVWVANETVRGAWHYDGEGWVERPELLVGLEIDGKSLQTAVNGKDQGVRLRDVDGDGCCELIVSNSSQQAIFKWHRDRRTWERSAFSLPTGMTIADSEGRDAGLRFIDLDQDGRDDLIFSNEKRYAACRFVSADAGWSDMLVQGDCHPEQPIPQIVSQGQNNGAWFHSGRLWVMNENTAGLPNHTQSVLLKKIPTLTRASKAAHVQSWHVLGPFPNNAPNSFDQDFGPEKSPAAISLDAKYDGVDDRAIGWEACDSVKMPAGNGFDLAKFCRERKFRGNDLIVYLATTVNSPAAQDTRLLIGSEDGVKVWVNGELVHRNFVRRRAELAQDEVSIRLRQGHNVLLVKLEQVGAGGALLAAVDAEKPVQFTAIESKPTAEDTTVRPKRKHVAHNNPRVIRPETDGTLRLLAPQAELYGREGENTIAIYDGQMCIGWWTSKEDYAIWQVEADREGTYDVHLHWAIPDNWANNPFSLECGASRLVQRMPSTGGFEHFHERKFGQLHLKKGLNHVRMKPIADVNGELADLKEIRLTRPNETVPAIPDGGMTPAQTVGTTQINDGLKMSVFASEPLVSNPVSICVDTKGRIWVAEIQAYRYYGFSADKQPRPDRIKVLEDTDGDGKADKATVFYEGLMAPMSLAVVGDRVFVAESPYLYVLEDKNGDLKADGPPKVLLQGFGGFNDDQALHGLALGPDHKLYLTQGDLTFDVTGPDGRRVQNDVGAVMRCDFDGTNLEVIAWDLKNPIEVAVDSFGDAWFSGNDDDGKRMCRLDYTLEGGYYGWRYWDTYGQRQQVFGAGPEAHWHTNVLGVVPPIQITGFGSPCGKLFVEGDELGKEYRGKLLHVDPGSREVRAYQLEPAGAAHSVRTDKLLSNAADTYFRPTDGALAPDGSLYLCDWYDQGVGGHAYNDPNRGRIYQVRRADGKHARIGKPGPFADDRDAIAALASPNLDTQFHARARLIGSGDKAIGPLTALLPSEDSVLAARAMWVLDRIGGKGRQAIVQQLQHANEKLRMLSVRILGRHGAEFESQILAMADDPSPHVRREVILAIRRFCSDASDKALIQLARQWDGQDRYYLEAVGIAARGAAGQANATERFPDFRARYDQLKLADSRRRDKLLSELVEAQGVELDPKTVGFVQLLRPNDAEQYLIKRFEREDVPAASRAAILASLGAVTDPAIGDTVARLIGDGSQPTHLRRLAIDLVRRNLRTGWSALRDSEILKQSITVALNEPELRPDALRLVSDGELQSPAEQVAKIATDKDGRSAERVTAIQSLAKIRWRAAAPSLASILADRFQEQELRSAALQALLSLGDLTALDQAFEGSNLDDKARRQIVETAVATPDGALWVLNRVRAKQLTKPLVDAAIAAGIQHADPNIRALYLDLMPGAERPKTLGSSVNRTEVLALAGDSERGRAVFHASQCARCHQVDVMGASIGPGLGVIGRKYGREALLTSILEPSAAISPDYTASIIETTDGRMILGFVSRNEASGRVTVRTVDGRSIEFSRDDVEAIKPQRASLMPEQLADAMTAQDLADLVAYLSSLKADTQLVNQWWALGAFPNDKQAGYDTDFGPEAQPDRIDFAKLYDALEGRKVRWIPFAPSPIGGSTGIDLQRFVADQKFRPHDLVTYYAVGIDSPDEQQVELLLGSEDGVKVWLNGRVVHQHLVRRPVHLGDDRIELPLNRGENVLLVKLEQISGGGGLIAAIKAESPVTFAKPRQQ